MDATPTAGRIEALLAESAWVRALAARLTRDAAEAEELVQESWIAALRRPPATDRPLRPWLAAVVRNAARYAGRGRARRARREHDVARPEASVAAPEEWIERLELQELLSQLVRELPDDLRQVCLLRFYEGLNSKEIAAEIGVPAGTVRWRLKQAVDRLRERLDERFDGDRTAWVAALAPLVRLEAAAGSGAALLTTTLLAKALAMPLFLKLALAAVTLALLSLPFLPSDDPDPVRAADERVAVVDPPVDPDPGATADESTSEPSVIQAETGRTPAESVDRASLDAAEDPEPAAAAAERPLTTLRLRVVDDRGRPVVGAHVAAQPSAALLSAGQDLAQELEPIALMREMQGHESTTGADGRAELETRLLVELGTVTVRAEGPNYGVWEESVTLDPGELIDRGDVVLTPGAALQGRVVDTRGEGVDCWLRLAPLEVPIDDEQVLRSGPSERVAADGTSAGTEDDGTLRLVGLPEVGCRLWASPKSGGSWSFSDPLDLRIGRLEEVELVIESTKPVPILRVLTPDGAPRGGAWFELESSSGTISANVDEDGEFASPMSSHVFRDVRVRVADMAQEYAPSMVRVAQLGDQTLEVRLGPAKTVLRSLHVRSAEGTALGDFHVRIDAFSTSRHLDAEGVGEGGLELRLPAEERFDLEVRAAGHQIYHGKGLLVGSPGDPWIVALEDLPGITGRVTKGGQPVAGARLRISHRTQANHVEVERDVVCGVRWRAGRDGRTDANGEFFVPLQYEGDLVLRVRALGAADALIDLGPFDPEVGRTGLVVELGDPGSVAGVVRDHRGEILPRTVVVACHPLHEGRRTRTDRDGHYRFKKLPPGDWHVRAVEKPDESGWSNEPAVDPDWSFPTNCSVYEGVESTLDIQVPGPVEVSGRVSGNLPLENLFVTASRIRERDPFGGWQLGGSQVRSDGTYRVTVPGPGDCRLLVNAAGFVGPLSRELELFESMELDVELELATLSGQYDGWVADTDGPLRARHEGALWSMKSRPIDVDEQGRFGPVIVPAGTIHLEWGDPEGAQMGAFRPSELTLEPGEERSISLP